MVKPLPRTTLACPATAVEVLALPLPPASPTQLTDKDLVLMDPLELLLPVVPPQVHLPLVPDLRA